VDTSHFKILHDLPSADPALDFASVAGGLSDVILESRPRFAVGIFGGWGAGKTTLMHEIKRQLGLRSPEEVITFWFSAWRYEREEHLIVPLLDTLREALVLWADERRRRGGKAALETAATVGKVIHALLSGVSLKVGVPGAVDLSLDANKALARAAEIAREDREADVPRSFYHASFRALQEAFGRFSGPKSGRRIVVFVDDLDRCLPESALQVLESMKLFFDLEGFVFVVGLDREVVESIIDAKYVRQSQIGPAGGGEDGYRVRGSDYVKKIFQVPFSLRPVASSELDPFLRSVYKDADLGEEQRQHLRDVVHPHLTYLVSSSGINPREVKRYLNAYTLAAKIQTDLDEVRLGALLALQTIEFRPDWQGVRRGIYAYRSLYIDALRQQIGGDATAVERSNPRLGGLPDSFLAYVQGPGRGLLSGIDVSEFIYIGEAVRSTGGSGLADAVQEVTRLRERVSELADTEGQEERLRLVALAKDEIKKARSFFERLKSSSGARLQRVERLLEVIDRSVTAASAEEPYWREIRSRWSDENGQRIDEIVDRLTEMVEGR
jgi:hypothetical protein